MVHVTDFRRSEPQKEHATMRRLNERRLRRSTTDYMKTILPERFPASDLARTAQGRWEVSVARSLQPTGSSTSRR
jgi:hypothetical protein